MTVCNFCGMVIDSEKERPRECCEAEVDRLWGTLQRIELVASSCDGQYEWAVNRIGGIAVDTLAGSTVRRVKSLDVVNEMRVIAEDLWLSQVTTPEEDQAFEALFERIEARISAPSAAGHAASAPSNEGEGPATVGADLSSVILPLLGRYPERAILCDDGHAPLIHFGECPICVECPVCRGR